MLLRAPGICCRERLLKAAWLGAIRCESTREERAELFSRMKAGRIERRAHVVVGRGEKRLLSDPGCELQVGKEEEKAKVRR